MPSQISGTDQEAWKRELLEQWIDMSNHNEIGLMDLVLLDGWIDQPATDGGHVSSESDAGQGAV